MAQENDTPRPVWLSELQVNEIVTFLHALELQLADEVASALESAWKVAPEHAAEALAKAIGAFHSEMRTVKDGLRALGAPHV